MRDPIVTKERFEAAVELINVGDVESLQRMLAEHSDLASARDESGATLLIRLIDYPGHRPNSVETARALLAAGAEVDARRDEKNGTALAGAVCTNELDLASFLIEAGADVHAPCGWRADTVLEFVDGMCQDEDEQDDDRVVRLRQIFGKAAGHPIPSRTPLGGSIPILFVHDVDEAVQWYREKLGFQLDWQYDAPDSECGKYGCIRRGGTEFHITTCECEDKGHTGKLNVRISCTDVDALFEEFQSTGDVEVRCPPESQPYGLREFEIIDLSGNWLTFHGPIPEED